VAIRVSAELTTSDGLAACALAQNATTIREMLQKARRMGLL
jgi:hypothetical protein